jgi:hypothetical protein
VGKKANGIVIDIAERTDGQWRVVELNDLQMSGLSENDPDIMYPALFDVIRSRNQRNYLGYKQIWKGKIFRSPTLPMMN